MIVTKIQIVVCYAAKDYPYPQKPLSELQHAPLEQGIVAVQLPTGRVEVLSGVCAIAPEKKATGNPSVLGKQ